MTIKIKNIIIGAIAAILCATIIIIAFEEKKSFYQILAGFLIFILPFTFITSFGSKVGSFVIVFISIMIAYFVSRFSYTDFWIGVILAFIIGGAACYFRVNPYKPFSPTDYNNEAEKLLQNRK